MKVSPGSLPRWWCDCFDKPERFREGWRVEARRIERGPESTHHNDAHTLSFNNHQTTLLTPCSDQACLTALLHSNDPSLNSDHLFPPISRSCLLIPVIPHLFITQDRFILYPHELYRTFNSFLFISMLLLSYYSSCV